MDIEDEVDVFCIRKNGATQFSETSENNKYCKVNCIQPVLNCVPLMIKHISLNQTGQIINNLFPSSVKFKNCLVYGKIVSKGSECKTSYNYLLDDGTASVFINLFRRTVDLDIIWKMDNELDAFKRQMLAQNKNEILNSLMNLMCKTKEQIDHSNIPMGSKVIVYGKPALYRGQVSLKVFHIIKDRKCDRDAEIHFKDYLIDWYKNNFIETN